MVMGPLDKSNVVRKRKSSEKTDTSQILGSSVNYAHEGVEGELEGQANEYGEDFGDFMDDSHGDSLGVIGGEIKGNFDDEPPPYSEIDDRLGENDGDYIK